MSQFKTRKFCSATLRPPGEARLEPSQKSKNFGLYLASPPRPELGSWKSTQCSAFTSTAKAHYSDRPSCGRKSKIFRFWGRAPRGLFTASSDRLGRDILTFWSESEFERSQKKFPRTFPNRVYKSYLPPAVQRERAKPLGKPLKSSLVASYAALSVVVRLQSCPSSLSLPSRQAAGNQ